MLDKNVMQVFFSSIPVSILNRYIPRYLKLVTMSNTTLPYIKLQVVYLPFSKIMIFVFLVFTRRFHILQYTYKSFSILCKASGVFANRTASSANKNKNNLSSLTVNKPQSLHLCLMQYHL